MDFLKYFYYGLARFRGLVYKFIFGGDFFSIGRGSKIFGLRYMYIERRISLGDFCWLQAIHNYKGFAFNPKLYFGSNVCLSDNVHISCAMEIRIGSGVLIGSSVYIGDHSHGSTNLDAESILIPPALRSLSDMAPIHIGANVWIGDGARILAGAEIPAGSIIGANSVVKGKFDEPGLIVGAPAVLKRVFPR